MTTPLRLLVKFATVALTLLGLTNGTAATIIAQNDAVTISGILNEADYEEFRSLLATHPKIDKIIFDNCMGGAVSAGYKIAQLIRKTQLETIAKHQCHSSCAYAFLAGKKRHFDTAAGTHLILLHASRNIDPDKDVATTINPALVRYLSYLTDYKLTPTVKNLIEHSSLETQGVVFITTNYLLFSTWRTVYCDGSERGDVGKCNALGNADPHALGIVTTGPEMK